MPDGLIATSEFDWRVDDDVQSENSRCFRQYHDVTWAFQKLWDERVQMLCNRYGTSFSALLEAELRVFECPRGNPDETWTFRGFACHPLGDAALPEFTRLAKVLGRDQKDVLGETVCAKAMPFHFYRYEDDY